MKAENQKYAMSNQTPVANKRAVFFRTLVEMFRAFFVLLLCNSTLWALPPFIELGPSDNFALDQPRVTIELFTDETGNKSLGPEFSSSFLLDTGASSILAVAGAVTELENNPNGFQIDGIFLEQGVAGFTEFDVTAPYRVDFAGTNGIRQTLSDIRLLSRKKSNFGSFSGIVGMPGIINRITTLDFTVWSNGGFGFLDVTFPESLPPDIGHRYTVPVFPVDFEQPGDPPHPTAAPLPFITATVSHQGVSKSGNFVFDTGAQLSILSEKLAFAIGLDANGNGDFSDEASGFLPIGGVGGEVVAPVLAFDKIRLPTEEGVELVWTDMEVIVLDIDPKIDGVFGSDLLTSGWIGAAFGIGSDGYINNVSFDFREMLAGNGKLLFDLNPDFDQVTVPPSASPNGLISLSSGGATYRQDFDTALGPNGNTTGVSLPTGWSANTGGITNTQITRVFPGSSVTSGTYNAGEDEDRTLANGNIDSSKENSLELFAQITGESNVRALRLEFDIEAWKGSATADDPGEAAYLVTLGVENENGFDTVVNFNNANKISTGRSLSPGTLAGNTDANRVRYDSGVVEINLATDSTVRLTFDAKAQGATSGYVFGLDNVVFRFLAAGDTDGNGVVDPFDLIRILSAQKFGIGPSDASWEEGDFDQDDDVDPFDIIEIQKSLKGKFPKTFSSDSENTSGEVVNLIVNPLTGNLTVDTQGLQLASLVIESQAGIFSGTTSPLWDTPGTFSADSDTIISNAVFGASFSGVDDLGDPLFEIASIDNFDLLADISVTYLEAGQSIAMPGSVTLSVPEPESITLLAYALLTLLSWSVCKSAKQRQGNHY